jgi:hypothetical protein
MDSLVDSSIRKPKKAHEIIHALFCIQMDIRNPKNPKKIPK